MVSTSYAANWLKHGPGIENIPIVVSQFIKIGGKKSPNRKV
jgi:hypothetical protein